jgi:hypothetical protein
MAMIEESVVKEVTDLSNLLLRHVTPLFSLPKGQRPELIGTGFFVSAHGQHFLVSAAHVLDSVSAPGSLHYYIDRTKLRKVTGSILRTRVPPLGTRSFDRIDIGVVRLEGPELPPYPLVDKYPISRESFLPRSQPRVDKQYLVVGFPESKSRADPSRRQLVSRPSAFRAVSGVDADYAALSITPETHLLLKVDASQMIFPGERVQAMPDPHGMSGSPVWLLFDSQGQNDPTVTPIVGIAIEHHRTTQAIVATDISAALYLIDEAVK